MYPDHRKEARTSAPKQPKGKLQLIVGEQRHDVVAVNDISRTGIRLEVRTPVDIGTHILLRYFDDKIDLRLNGIVVWNSAASPDDENAAGVNSHIIGIELASPSLLETYL